MNKKPHVCPDCGHSDCLSVELKVDFNLEWSRDEYVIGHLSQPRAYLPSSPDNDSPTHCGNCGWQGRFDELKRRMQRYVVTLEIAQAEWADLDTFRKNLEATLDRGGLRNMLQTKGETATVVDVTFKPEE